MRQAGIMALFGSIALVAAACASAPDVADSAVLETRAASVSTATARTGPASSAGVPAGPSALEDPLAEEFPEPLVLVEDIISGGPPPDGIPPLDEPVFVSVSEATARLESGESVVALVVNGDARAYPVRVLIWHEIVNDTVGGVPVSITYCPLCNSAVSYRRQINGVETTFGTSGSLYASALVMYDRLTESLWTHFDGRAVVGVLAGMQLEAIASPLMAWDDFVESYPTGQVLDWTMTGFERDYGRNPYVGYDDPDAQPFLFRGVVDDRERAMQRVVGITNGAASLAYSTAALAVGERSVTPVTMGDVELVILWKAGQLSALDASTVDGADDVGSVGVFVPEVDGEALTLGVRNGTFMDDETGSTWTIAGTAIDGPLTGRSLERVEHLDTFWFAWSAYRPNTTLIEK